MLRLLFIFIYTIHVATAAAQMKVRGETSSADSFQVVFKDEKWVVMHMAQQGDNIFSLAKKYHVPPAMLSDINHIAYQQELKPNEAIYIPLGAYNMLSDEPQNSFDTRPLYYIVRQYDNLFRLAHMAGVQQRRLQEWNRMDDNYITEGKRLFVGWVMYDVNASSTDAYATTDINKHQKGATVEKKGNMTVGELADEISKNRNSNEQVIVVRKGKPKDTLSDIERMYMEQTQNEQVFDEEKGTAVFYDMKGSVSGSNLYYAFHNKAARGSIIKVYNPGTDKSVYVKVLGPMPNTKQYYNCIIGIGESAKQALMVAEDRMFCELKYNPVF